MEYQSFVEESFTNFATKEEFTWLSTINGLIRARFIANFRIFIPFFAQGCIFASLKTLQTIVSWVVTQNFDLDSEIGAKWPETGVFWACPVQTIRQTFES